jgi:hypothetical protein
MKVSRHICFCGYIQFHRASKEIIDDHEVRDENSDLFVDCPTMCCVGSSYLAWTLHVQASWHSTTILDFGPLHPIT